MSANTKSILEELYALDPDLRSKESEIKKIIEKMMKNRPEVKMDESFRTELKAKIMSEIHAEKNTRSWLTWSLPFAGGAIACGALGIFLWQSQILQPTQVGSQISFKQNINRVASLGEVNLATTPTNVRNQSGGGGMGGAQNMAMSNVAAPMADTSSIAPVESQITADSDAAVLGTDAAISSKRMATDMMIYPPVDMPIYNYVYSGELTLPEGPLTVYRKNPTPFNTSETASILKGFSIDGIDLGKMRNLGVSNISLVEDRDFGYSVNVDFVSGNISMYQNYMRWPQIQCDQNGCETQKTLTENDIPADSVMITAADKFLADYGIDTTGYGDAIVDGSWKIWYARSVADGMGSYVPDMYTVTYPLLIDGQEIYEEGGMPKGLTLSYDIRNKRISNFYGLEKQNLDSSEYAAITNTDTINQMIKNGGRYIYSGQPVDTSGRKTVDIELSAPKLSYIHVYGEWKNGRSEEYYVPAYVFPIKNPPENAYYIPTSITIPLVQEFVQTIDYQPMDPIIYSDMPIAETTVKEEALVE